MAKPPVILIASPQRSGIERILSILSPVAAITGVIISIRMARRAIKADDEKSATINSPDFINDPGLDVGMGEDPVEADLGETAVIDTGMGEDPADVEMGDAGLDVGMGEDPARVEGASVVVNAGFKT